MLLRKNIRLKGPPSFEDDIKLLKKISMETRDVLLRHSTMRFQNQTIHIKRALAQQAYATAMTGPLMLVGVPGAGKSNTLINLMDLVQADQHDVVLVQAADLAANNASPLKALHPQHTFVEVLRHWPDEKMGFLIIDALDAVRDESIALPLYSTLENLLSNPGRWTVVLSVRLYEAMNTSKIRALLKGKAGLGDPLQFAELKDTRHLKIPELTMAELEGVVADVPPLKELLQKASEKLVDLLKIPFNLGLAVDLLYTKENIALLSAIKNEVELLKLYWDVRINRHENHRQFDRLLKKLIQETVTQRSLYINAPETFGESGHQAVTELQRIGILAEQKPKNLWSGTSRITFFHHILYDFTAAVLYFDEDWVSRITERQELVLSLRPSLNMKLQLLWDDDETRGLFWSESIQLASRDSVPELAKMAAAHSFIQNFIVQEDFQGWVVAFESPDTQNAAVLLFQHLVGELQAFLGQDADLLARLDVFGGLMSYLTEPQFLEHGTVTSLNQNLLGTLAQLPGPISEMTTRRIASASRRYFEVQMAKEPARRTFHFTLLGLMASLDVETDQNLVCLRHLLQTENLRANSQTYLLLLCMRVEKILSLAPDFAVEIFEAVFSHVVGDDQTRLMGMPSGLINFTTTTKDDFSGYRNQLAQAFQRHLEIDSVAATRLLIKTSSAHLIAHQEQPTQIIEFDFLGQRTGIIEDGFDTEWQGHLPGDDHLLSLGNMVQSFGGYIMELKEVPQLLRLWDTARHIPMPAIIWNIWLRLAAQTDTFGDHIRPVLWQCDLLSSPACHRNLQALLARQYSRCDSEQQQLIEEALAALGSSREDFVSGRWMFARMQQVNRERLKNQLPEILPPEAQYPTV